MKKTLNVNLNGRVFTIDEDAYSLLDNYLNSIRICFRKEEGASEIIADFEARIEELFSERNRLGHQVITLEHVEDVIARVGQPADFSDEEEKEEKHHVESELDKGKKKFYRDMDNKLLGGVCSGVATYFGWDVAILRLILIIIPFVISPAFKFSPFHGDFPFNFLSNFPVLLIMTYLILWVIAPAAQTVEQKLQMQGKPITPDNIGKAVAAESAPVATKEKKGCLTGFVNLFVFLLKVGIAGLGCLIGIPLLFALMIVLVVLFAVVMGVGGGLIGVGGGMMGLLPSFITVNHPMLAAITGIILIGIPVITIIYSIITHFTKAKPLHQSIKWVLLITWIVAFILFFFSGFRINKTEWNKNPGWPNVVAGNNIPFSKTYDLADIFTVLEINDNLTANIYIEQIPLNAQSSIEISGDENLVELVKYDLYNARLELSASNKYRAKRDLTIHLKTNDLKYIRTGSIGNIRINGAFTSDELEVIMKGVGNFNADSLYANSLTINTQGVGTANLSGRTDKISLETSGTGSINAIELQSDTVYARVNGVGSIQCYPIDYLEGRVNGIGSITYKEEPKHKDTGTLGIGKIKKK